MRTAGRLACWSPLANGPLMARQLPPTGGPRALRLGIMALSWALTVERVTRIELALSAWEADVLPLNYTRRALAGRSGHGAFATTSYRNL